MGEPLDSCFAELLKRRAWYKPAHNDRRLASYHKKLFQQGLLPDEQKRLYLCASGYSLTQQELWTKNKISL